MWNIKPSLCLNEYNVYEMGINKSLNFIVKSGQIWGKFYKNNHPSYKTPGNVYSRKYGKGNFILLAGGVYSRKITLIEYRDL
jgi:hypothetical protein